MRVKTVMQIVSITCAVLLMLGAIAEKDWRDKLIFAVMALAYLAALVLISLFM